MKTSAYLLLSVLLLVVFSWRSYAQTASDSIGCAPATINFTAPASASSYFWDFKDGSTSALQNPSNTFVAPGVYLVDFKETPNGPVLGSIQITVYPKPTPSFSAPLGLSACVTDTLLLVNATSLPGGILQQNVSWTFGNGTGASSDSVFATYAQAGIYDLSLQLQTNYNSCNSSALFTDTVFIGGPTANFSTNPPNASSCSTPFTVGFTNTSTGLTSLTYNWNFGNGTNSTSQTPPSAIYTVDSLYHVQLLVIDSIGCTDSSSLQIPVGSPLADISVPDTVCVDDPFFITNNSSTGTYLFTFDTNHVRLSSPVPGSPRILYPTPGMRRITIRVLTAGGSCAANDTVFFYVQRPEVEIFSSNTYSCESPLQTQHTYQGNFNFTQVTWSQSGNSSTNDTLQSTLQANPAYYDQQGRNRFKTQITVQTAWGCTASAEVIDTIHLPWARLMPNVAEGCAPLTVTLHDSSRSNEAITNYTWFLGDGSPPVSASAGTPITHTFVDTGTYFVELAIENSGNCRDTSHIIEIQVGEQHTTQLLALDSNLCVGDTLHVINQTQDSIPAFLRSVRFSSNFSFGCSPSDTLEIPIPFALDTQAIIFSFEDRGCYTEDTLAQNITVGGEAAQIAYEFDCSQPLDVNFYAQLSTASASWEIEQQAYFSDSVNHLFSSNGDFKVVLTVSDSVGTCPAQKDSVVFKARQVQANLNLNALVCQGDSLFLDASSSTDNEVVCRRGFAFGFSSADFTPWNSSSPTYATPCKDTGTFTAFLRVEDVNGCTDSAQQQFTVSAPLASIDSTPLFLCYPDTLSVTSLSSASAGIKYHIWDFDGLQTDTGITASIAYDTIPSLLHFIFLTAVDSANCTAKDSAAITFFEPTSSVSFLQGQPQLCAGDSVVLEGSDFTAFGSSLDFNWLLSDSLYDGQQLSFQAIDTGALTVEYRYRVEQTSCVRSQFIPLFVNSTPNTNFISALDSLSNFCAPQNIEMTSLPLSNDPINDYFWDFGNGQQGSDSIVSTVYQSGEFTIIHALTTSFGCTDTSEKTIEVFNTAGDFISSTDSICLGDSIQFALVDTSDVFSYSWDFGDGNSLSNQDSVYHQYLFVPPSGKTIAKLLVFGPDSSCPQNQQLELSIIDVEARLALLAPDSIFCEQEEIAFQNNSLRADAHQWYLNSNSLGNSEPIRLTASDTGNFEILLISTFSPLGCADSATQLISIKANPALTIGNDTICQNDEFRLLVDFDSTSNSLSTSLSGVLVINDTLAGRLTEDAFIPATATSTFGCSTADTGFVFVLQPLPNFEFDTTIILGDTISIPLNLFDSVFAVNWISDSVPLCTVCNFPLLAPTQNNSYVLFYQDTLGCFEAENAYKIQVVRESRVELPLAFSPNGDGNNDVFAINGWGLTGLQFFRIFNRWGELLFETNNLNEGWDGYANGVLQNADIYVYQVSANTILGEEIAKEGHFELIR